MFSFSIYVYCRCRCFLRFCKKSVSFSIYMYESSCYRRREFERIEWITKDSDFFDIHLVIQIWWLRYSKKHLVWVSYKERFNCTCIILCVFLFILTLKYTFHDLLKVYICRKEKRNFIERCDYEDRLWTVITDAISIVW